ncbi:mannitol dehydrogenase family protein [Nocardiopsis tropica]|uniref:Mannitol dehydrogenase family protein n=1 Tax=Nocardiopsis tropica TaxID=109330 RepID=A0ABU7KKN1_9ACTN|nr:mannitol dehydrogenase family protein [Nocardiopsis umidischolae]MEE2049847.1 mannitol dehydrogenase family protein [Nocardiopsis umidischolae]
MSIPALAPRLGRDALDIPGAVPPVRIVHLGLGAFHRSHQAWYTARAADAAEWGIAAYTGRRPHTARALERQECVYTLVERAADRDRFTRIGSIVRAVPGDDVDDFVRTLASPDVAVLTLTITEAGYRLDAAGDLDLGDPDVGADLEVLRALADGEAVKARPRTALGRVLLGLHARHRAGAPPIAIVSCDNVPDNGTLVERALTRLAGAVSPEAAALVFGASFVSTSVDRITRHLDGADVDVVRAATGRLDEAPVVAEPFSDWVLSGHFPSGRPDWESAGARFVDDITPWEARKLWLLNGAHTLLAASGTLRGHRTVAEAVADPVCRAQVEALWDEAARQLAGLDLRGYRTALVERFGNPRMEHRLAQIAADSFTKLRLRVVPVARGERAAGRSARGCATAIAACVVADRGRLTDRGVLTGLLHDLDPGLAADPGFVAVVLAAVETLSTT